MRKVNDSQILIWLGNYRAGDFDAFKADKLLSRIEWHLKRRVTRRKRS